MHKKDMTTVSPCILDDKTALTVKREWIRYNREIRRVKEGLSKWPISHPTPKRDTEV